jgi:hypothetical protein
MPNFANKEESVSLPKSLGNWPFKARQFHIQIIDINRIRKGIKKGHTVGFGYFVFISFAIFSNSLHPKHWSANESAFSRFSSCIRKNTQKGFQCLWRSLRLPVGNALHKECIRQKPGSGLDRNEE